MQYTEFLKSKVVIAERFGIDTSELEYSAKLFPHQRDITNFCLEGGRRAIFASFGLGKTFMQLEIAKQLIQRFNKPFLIVCPLGVSGEFKRDNRKLGTGLDITYIVDTGAVDLKPQIYLTNYERVRMGDIDPTEFCGVSFDEGSILRNLQTETTNYILSYFKQVPFRYVATATPTPNDFIEILNYADYLGVISRGHALTRFFQRDSTKAGNLKLYDNKKKEFWQWVSTWAAFINTPADLGYDSTGYDLPELNIIEHCIKYELTDQPLNKWGEPILFKDLSKSLLEVSKEKRDSMSARCNEVLKILKDNEQKFFCEGDAQSGVCEGLLPAQQRSPFDKTENPKQTELRGKQTGAPREEQEVGRRKQRPDEGAATQKSADTPVEGIQKESLSNEQTTEQGTGKGKQAETMLRHDGTGLSTDAFEPGGEVYDLRQNPQGSCSEEARRLSNRPLPQDGEGEGSSLPSLQRGTGSVSGQSGNIETSNRLSQQIIIWCDLNAEQRIIESLLKSCNISFVSITGGESTNVRESKMDEWRDKKVDVFLSKTSMYGAGINMQQASFMIYVGITYKFQDFFQGIHRCYRFGQTKQVNIHIIYTENEYEVLKSLKAKWAKHIELNNEMIALVKENGLNSNLIKSQMERQIFNGGRKMIYDNCTLYNNDTVVVHADKNEMPDNSVDMILTSIPFGDHYEYSDNYNDFGHNHGNEKFFEQMDYLTPNLLRVLKPGRIAAIHVKDRIRYSYQNGTSFTTIADFSGQTVAHFIKHGFYLMGKITVTTDVVAENNQTYRLGWTEQCKDATKMGVGLPEYVLIFRKAPTEMNNAYADDPVTKKKKYPEFILCPSCKSQYNTDRLIPFEKADDNIYKCPECQTSILESYVNKNKQINKDGEIYTKALWQLDAHAYQRSSGDRFLTREELQSFDLKRIVNAWKQHNEKSIYEFTEHLRVCEDLDEMEKLSSTFMTLPVHSNNDMVWTDVNRMNTLNAKQVNAKKEKHICPLQIDIIRRLLNRYTMPGEMVDDPFGGLFSTPYIALEMGRKAVSVELNSEYFNDGLYYVKAKMHELSVPTLFDFLKTA